MAAGSLRIGFLGLGTVGTLIVLLCMMVSGGCQGSPVVESAGIKISHIRVEYEVMRGFKGYSIYCMLANLNNTAKHVRLRAKMLNERGGTLTTNKVFALQPGVRKKIEFNLAYRESNGADVAFPRINAPFITPVVEILSVTD